MKYFMAILMRFVSVCDDERLEKLYQAKRGFPALVVIWCSLLAGSAFFFSSGQAFCSDGMPPKSILHEDLQAGMDSNNQETNPSMVFTRDGELYLAFEAETSSGNSFILLYGSNNNGRAWEYRTALTDAAADLREPSLSTAGSTLLMAYISDDGATAVPKVATADVSANPVAFTVHPVPVASSDEGHLKPEIITDYAPEDSSWYAYLVCQAASSDGSYDILYWLSRDEGETWVNRNLNSAPTRLFGREDATNWRDPDLAYSGSFSLGSLYVVAVNEKASVQELWGSYLGRHGLFYPEPERVLTLGGASSFGIPDHAVDPDIASSGHHLLIACTVASDGNDNIAYCRESWSVWSTEVLQGQSSIDDFAPSLSASGGQFHLSYTNLQHEVYYVQLPPSEYETWQTEPVKVNDVAYASAVHTKKAIAADWQNNKAVIAWTDYRDGVPDYDIFTDYVSWPTLVPLFMLLLGD
jgi:hypothetical protein